MKRFLLLLLLLASGPASTAQSWCPPGAQWIYNVSDPWITARRLFTYVGDTVVDGYPAQRIDHIYVQTFPMNVVSDWSPMFTRTNSDLVWEWNGAEWDTLYWFSALPGDTWQPFWPLWDNCSDHAWLVLDTSTTVVSGIALRSLLLEMTAEGEPTGQTQMIYERLGGGIGLNFPRMHTCVFINECFCTFQCYQDQDIIPQDEPCALPLALLDQAASAAPPLQVYPNPAQGPVTVQRGGVLAAATMEVYDAIGCLVQRQAWPSGQAMLELDLGERGSGVYLLRVTGRQGSGMQQARLLWQP